MSLIVVLFGVVVLGAGAYGLAWPAGLITFVESVWKSPTAFPAAVAIRLILGVVLLLAAPDCRHPGAVTVIGAIALVAAIAALGLGRARISGFVDWWIQRPSGFVRAWAGIAMGFGGFLIYTAV